MSNAKISGVGLNKKKCLSLPTQLQPSTQPTLKEPKIHFCEKHKNQKSFQSIIPMVGGAPEPPPPVLRRSAGANCQPTPCNPCRRRQGPGPSLAGQTVSVGCQWTPLTGGRDGEGTGRMGPGPGPGGGTQPTGPVPRAVPTARFNS